MIGAVTKEPTQEKMFRMKLFSATPEEAFLGINSVNIVVAMLKISMDPIPKKKFAIICRNSSLVPLAIEHGIREGENKGTSYRRKPKYTPICGPAIPNQRSRIQKSTQPGILTHAVFGVVD